MQSNLHPLNLPAKLSRSVTWLNRELNTVWGKGKLSFLAESQLSIWLCLMPSPSTNKRREKEKKQLKWEMAPLLLNTVKEPSREKCQKEKKKEKKGVPRHTAWYGRAGAQDRVLGRGGAIWCHPWLLILLWGTWKRLTREGGSGWHFPHLHIPPLSVGLRHKSWVTKEPFLSH